MHNSPELPILHPARSAAIDALKAVWGNQATLEEFSFSELEAKERAEALRITRASLRHFDSFEALIKTYSKSTPIPEIAAILHLGAYELLIEKSPAYAVVHSYVEIAKTRKRPRAAAGYLNAVLRKISNHDKNLRENNSFGAPLSNRIEELYGKPLTKAMSDVQNLRPPTDLRLKQGENLDKWARKFGGIPLAAHHAIRLPHAGQISALDGYKEGKWWVQDVAATIAVDCFSDLEGKTALDICAAPGGKAMQLADYGAHVTALDISEARMKRVHKNLERMGFKAEIIVEDGRNYSAKAFDRILLDAPCSATGTFRRHPDLRFHNPLKRLNTLKFLQGELLAQAYKLLNPNGELLYVTCSLLPEEGEKQIERFLKNTDAKIEPLNGARFGLSQDHSPYLRSLPCDYQENGGMDGFFIAKILKP